MTGDDMRDTDVAVVTVNYRTPDLALAAVASLLSERAALPRLRAVLVDGGSGDGSAERIAAGLDDPRFAGWVTPLPLDINGGFGWANNQAILALLRSDAPPEFIYLLNPDARIEPGALSALVALMRAHPRCGAAGGLLLDPDGTDSGSHFAFPTPRGEVARGAGLGLVDRLLGTGGGWLPQADATVEADWVTGACVLLRVAALREAGLFDDGFFLYFEEVELMWRMREKGWTILHEPASRVFHEGGAATGINDAGLRPLPGYWFAAQRRFFALTQGRGAAARAAIGWLAGHAVRRLRRLLRLGGGDGVPGAGRGRLRHVRHDPADVERARTDLAMPAGAPPLWMRLQPDLPTRR